MSDSRNKSRERGIGLAEESYDLDNFPQSKGRYRSSSAAKNIWHSRFVEFFEFSPIPFLVLNGSIISEVNVAACEFLGKGIGGIQKKVFKDLFVDPERIEHFLGSLGKDSSAQQSINQLTSGVKVRLYAVQSFGSERMIRVGLTYENSDPRDLERLRHVLLAAKEAISIYNNGQLVFSNKSSRALLREHDTKCLTTLLSSVGISESIDEINGALEHTNLWNRPVSLDAEPYRLTISRIFYENLPEREYVIKLSPFIHNKTAHRRGLDAIPDSALTPLTVVKSAASLLSEVNLDSESFQTVLRLLKENVDLLCRVLEHPTKVEDGHKAEGIPIVSVLSNSVEFVRQTRDFEIEIEVNNPGLKIWADEEKAVKAFITLFLLSLKFTDTNEIRISVSEDPQYLVFRIYVIDVREGCPETCLKGIQRTLDPVGADIEIIEEEEFYIQARFPRRKT